jgi:prepilin-type N-terminal cleavage/methylation domain-containing protein
MKKTRNTQHATRNTQIAKIVPSSSCGLTGNEVTKSTMIQKHSQMSPRFHNGVNRLPIKDRHKDGLTVSFSAGFTLVELAAVIVIIGFLVAGVLQGQELIKQAEIRTVIKDFQSFKSAYFSFKDKYNCLPGDCLNARTFFNSTDCPDVSSYNCNGNGDSLITGVANTEGARLWQHLGLSGFLKGAYQGYYNGSGDNYLAVVVPQGPIKGMGYGAFAADFTTLWTGGQPGNQNFIRASSVYQNATLTRIGGVSSLTSYDASIIDIKIDDGFPGRGKLIIEPHISSSNCVSTTNTATSIYNIQDITTRCVPSFLLD